MELFMEVDLQRFVFLKHLLTNILSLTDRKVIYRINNCTISNQSSKIYFCEFSLIVQKSFSAYKQATYTTDKEGTQAKKDCTITFNTNYTTELYFMTIGIYFLVLQFVIQMSPTMRLSHNSFIHIFVSSFVLFFLCSFIHSFISFRSLQHSFFDLFVLHFSSSIFSFLFLLQQLRLCVSS